MRNYLRVRGEYFVGVGEVDMIIELPPRARRIRGMLVSEIVALGTTSACAENTHPHQTRFRGGVNYLRVRGEYK